MSATNSNLTISLNLNCDHRGSAILQYELSVSTDGLNYTVVTSYDGISPVKVLDSVVDNLVTG